MKQDGEYLRRKILIGASLFCFILLMAMPLGAQESASMKAEDTVAQKNSVESKEPMENTVIEGELSIDNILNDSVEASAKQETPPSPEDQQFVRINQSLKNLIEENQELMQQKDVLQKDIEALRGERMVQETRLRTLARERVSTLKKSQVIDSVTASYEKEIQNLKKELEDVKQSKPEVTAVQEPGHVSQETAVAAPVREQSAQQSAAPIAVMRGAADMALEMGKLVEENLILRKDTIKLHYNLANLFFEQGRYDMASVEYNRVLDLMPQDAATHYNLAFVSAEYLKDYPTAIEHYKKYLTLAPTADDIGFVKGQILQLQLKVQNKIDSYVDKDEGQTDLPLK